MNAVDQVAHFREADLRVNEGRQRGLVTKGKETLRHGMDRKVFGEVENARTFGEKVWKLK